MLKAFYSTDLQLLVAMAPDRLAAFEKWFAQLEEAYTKVGKPYGNSTQSLAETTGIECWVAFFDDGLEPADAARRRYVLCKLSQGCLRLKRARSAK